MATKPLNETLEQLSVKLISVPFVIPGLVPGIHVLIHALIHVDGRDEPGHDGKGGDSTGAKLALARSRSAPATLKSDRAAPGCRPGSCDVSARPAPIGKTR